MNVIIDSRTGEEVAEFDGFVDAAVFRRDVLRPQLPPDDPCPYEIRGVARRSRAAA